MLKNTLLIALLLLAIYLYYQNRKLRQLPATTPTIFNYDSDNEEEVPFPSRQKLQFELQQAQEKIKEYQRTIRN
jgi:hypothetical protein